MNVINISKICLRIPLLEYLRDNRDHIKFQLECYFVSGANTPIIMPRLQKKGLRFVKIFSPQCYQPLLDDFLNESHCNKKKVA